MLECTGNEASSQHIHKRAFSNVVRAVLSIVVSFLASDATLGVCLLHWPAGWGLGMSGVAAPARRC